MSSGGELWSADTLRRNFLRANRTISTTALGALHQGPSYPNQDDSRIRTMAHAHKLDCESVENDCRFIIQSEDEDETLELAQKHMRETHGKELTVDELRQQYLQTV